MKKQNALQRIDSHEKIHSIEKQIHRIESILLVASGALITGMAYVIFTLLTK